jgi:hypothetical protein
MKDILEIAKECGADTHYREFNMVQEKYCIAFHNQQELEAFAAELLKQHDSEKDVRISQLEEVASALQEWVKAIPQDIVLPSMPGIDGDYVDGVIANKSDWLYAVPPMQKEGYVLVPIEPTKGMIEAIWALRISQFKDARDIYEDLIAASQEDNHTDSTSPAGAAPFRS